MTNHTATAMHPAGVPIIGQPVTIISASIPVNAQLRCNCGLAEDTTVPIIASVPAACPGCKRVFTARFDPSTGQVQIVQIQATAPETIS